MLLRIHHVIVVFLIGLMLMSCATTLPQRDAAQNADVSWEARVRDLSRLQNWKLNALIAVRSAKESGSASLQWQQQNQSYHIVLFGPLGTNSYELTGQPGHVELAAANGKKVVANSPEQLLAEQSGWMLPMSHLYYWIRGLPVPHLPSQQQFDAYHHLVLLNQQGWSIQFLRYTSTHNMDLPSKIFLEHPQLKVRIVISQWTL